MDEANTGRMTPFDTAVSKDSFQILKATLPYLPPNMQRMLAIYTKFSELSNTISYFRNFSPELQMMSYPQAMQPLDFLSDLRQYTCGNLQNSIDQMLFAFNAIQLMQSCQDMPDPE